MKQRSEAGKELAKWSRAEAGEGNRTALSNGRNIIYKGLCVRREMLPVNSLRTKEEGEWDKMRRER